MTHRSTVRAVAFAPKGKLLLTGSFDHTARLWDAATGKPIGQPLVHQGRIRTAAFSPDGARVLTASFDHTARLWDAATSKPIGPCFGHEGAVVSATFQPPDGKTIATAGTDGTVRLWNAPPPLRGEPEQIRLWAQALTGRELDGDRAIRILDAAAWADRQRQLRAHGGPPSP
jgi:WD40 repeat protein